MLGWLCPVWGVVWPAGDLQASGPAAVAETSNTNIWTGDGGHGAAAVTRAGTTNCGITYLYMYTAGQRRRSLRFLEIGRSCALGNWGERAEFGVLGAIESMIWAGLGGAKLSWA